MINPSNIFIDTLYKGYPTLYEIQIPSHGISYLCSSPFVNCQIATIGQFENLIDKDCSNIMDIIYRIQEICHIKDKSIIQIDIHEYYYNLIKNYIKEYTKFEYTNTTGSKMVQVLIDTRKE